MLFQFFRVFIVLLLLASPALAEEAVSDIRVLIDTSGSMKQNDPHNLRIPALKLLINLLPPGSRAGVWLFDAVPQALLAPVSVDAAWKSKALKAADKIHSRGQFTHIESALMAAGAGWYGSAPATAQRSVILLTDGVVDVSKKPEESAASRVRLVSELLPKFQMAGVNIHTIALSSESDQELLRQISLATGGWNEVVENPEALQRAFAQMLNKVAPQEGVPLQDNRFKVDAGIEEFTVLALLRPDAGPTRLAGPDGHEFALEQAHGNTRWVHEPGYDLITVSHPAVGDWKLLADSDPANRVLIVTNLKMAVTPIPNFVSPGELPGIEAAFSEHGQPVEREEFLRLLKVDAGLSGGAERQDFPMPQDLARPAVFTLHLEPAPQPGAYTLTVTADGKTFQRLSTQSFHLLPDLVTVATETHPEAEPPQAIVTLTPNADALLAGSLDVQASLADAHGDKAEALNAERHEGVWRYTVLLPEPHGQRVVNFSATAKTPDGKDIAIPLKPLLLEGKAEDAPPPEPPVPEVMAKDAPPPEPPVEAHPEPAAEGPDWQTTALEAVAINLVLFGAGFFVYRKIRQRNEAAIARLLDKLSS